jgi:3-phosphoshikimate 1-carboxyvinyltransferase
MLGALAGFDVTATITGDASLQKRPFQRVTHPLAQMGAQFSGSSLPITIKGRNPLRPLYYENDLSSAQVKSAILLAGLRAKGQTVVHEVCPSRDHTEKMLRTFGVPVSPPPAIAIQGPATLKATDISIPGDISAAAFLLVAGMVSGTKGLTLNQVGINPGRAAYLKILKAMGAAISFSNRKNDSGEETADIYLKSGPLVGIETSPKEAPALIDEFPILFVAAALAKTQSKFRGLSELRRKESDRLALMGGGLKANGVDARIVGDDLYIHPGPLTGGAVIDPEMDHRIAMAFLVLGMACQDPITVKGAETISTSFPGFAKVMNGLGAKIKDNV